MPARLHGDHRADAHLAAPVPAALAVAWFDKRQDRGIHHQDWRLEDNPAAVALFRREARAFGRPLPPARPGG
jgi:hypothetical protein